MSYLGAALVLQPEEAERVSLPHGGFELLADASQTKGALGANRLPLGEGSDGAHPHYHATADLIAILPPGVERSYYFRAQGRIRRGLESFDTPLPEQERYDVHFLDTTDWQTIHTRRPPY